jgi:hypothetical protein
MDQELKNLIKELIDDPKVRQQRQDSYKEALKFTKNEKERLELKLKETRELKSLIPLYTKDAKLRKERITLVEKQIDSTENLIKAEERQTEIVGKLSKSFVGLGKAAFEGQGSISAFTDNVRGLGLIGNRLDVNIETFRQLSQSGANFGKSIVDLRLAAGEAALPLDDFAKLVASNSNNLAALFGSTTAGAKQIANLGRVTRELGIDRLAPLGFTVDEINETLLLNLDSQRRTGVANQLTDQQRVNSAINFAEELDRLAKLTGAQRDELRSQIEQQQSNERFQVALQGQTEETRRRLQGFAGTIGNIAPGLNEGFQDLIANAGVPVTESALALVQNIPQAQSIIRSLINGTVSAEQALGQIRDVSTASISRFSKATVTGQVEFLRFQGDIINLGRRIVDVDGVFQEQSKSATSLVSNLTSFEQATKVLSSQFQGIETALLQSFGPALGGLVGGIQTAFGAGGAVAKALAGAPALTASLIAGGLIGKVLFGPAVQVLTTAKGVAMGINMSKGGGMFGGMGKAFGKGGTGKGGAFGNFARTGIGRTVGAAGVGVNALSAYSSLSDDDKTNDASGIGTIAGTAIGGLLGLFGGPAGALLGASLGGAAGGALGGMFGGGKAFGGGMDAGKTYLTGERGPEMITAGTSSTVTANSDLKNTFNTEALEMKLNSTVSELNAANKTLTNMVNSVNTLVAVESRALKAVETTARKDRNQVGMV